MVPVAMIDATGGATHFDFESLYADQFNPMVRLAGMITGSTAAAEDVVQDAFAALLLRSRRVDHPIAYLRRSVVNGCIGRSRRLQREVLGEPPDTSDDGADTAQHSASLSLAELQTQIRRLPARQRAVVVLRVVEGWSENDTARALGVRPGSVGSLLHRALNALRVDVDVSIGRGDL